MLRAMLVVFLLLIGRSSARADSSAAFTQAALGNVFIEGDQVVVPVRGSGDHVSWRVTNFFGDDVASGEESLTAGGAELRPHIAGCGYFTLTARLLRGGREAGSAQTALAVVPQPKPAHDDSPFGVMTHFAKGWPTDIIPLIRKAGIVHDRDEQPWRQVERQRADYEFPPRLSDYMAELERAHIDPLIVLAFANPLYDAGKTPYSEEGRAAFAAYAASVARHYQPGLHEVEIWNEYNGSFCEGPCREDRPGYYAAMLKDAYRSVKAATPSVTVLGGAGVPIPMDYFLALFEKGALESMDALVIHPYRKDPDGIEQDVEALRRLMSRYGAPKPIWATEFSDLADMRRSRGDVARYLVRMSTMLLAAKVERIFWYLLRDYQEFIGLGLLRDESDPLGRYTPTPAYAAYATIIHELDGATFIRREPSDPGIRIYSFAAGSADIRVAWAESAEGIVNFPGADSVRVVDMMGGEKIVPAHDGAVPITLGQDPVYIIGGGSPTGKRSASAASAASQTLADSEADFSLEQGAKGWSYGMVSRPDGQLAVGGAFAGPLEMLQPSPSGDGWFSPGNPALRIKARIMHPGRVNGGAAWAVRSWTAPLAGPVRVTGAVALTDLKNAGVTFAVVINGRAVYTADLHGDGVSGKANFDLPVTLASGEKVNFAVGPAPAGGINFDATRFSAVITSEAAR